MKFTKKEISDFLKREFENEMKEFSSMLRKCKLFFVSGAECKNKNNLINWLYENTGNWLDIRNDVESQFKSFGIDKKENRGGAGRNQGRRLKYGEETVKVNYRVPVSFKDKLNSYVSVNLDKYAKAVKGSA